MLREKRRTEQHNKVIEKMSMDKGNLIMHAKPKKERAACGVKTFDAYNEPRNIIMARTQITLRNRKPNSLTTRK